jgi:murein DD-endopeptidase MepM/ murein hydrolase activator NlpD
MKNYWSSKLSRVIVTWLVAFCPFFSSAQFSRPEVKFPTEEKYLYPINPGLPGSLAGTMGELRSTHFHSGIDIRTDNIIGLPVLASKSGYISRISVSPSGYGNVLYITHPDGFTTLYAHLDRFRGPVAQYVLQEQYRRRSADVDLFFRENQFLVKRGDTVALSGNSGSSSGPHLHFDIRDPENFALNPLLVESFPEITDNLPPAVEKIALKTLDINSRINDKFGRFEFYAQRIGKDFIFSAPILATGNIGVEILAKDKLAVKSKFYGGVNYIEMRVDSQLIFNQSIDKINIAETRSIYTLMDFKTMRNNGARFYKLYVDDGNDLNFYDKSPGTGKIKVDRTKVSNVQITMKDTYGNFSNISFSLKPTGLTKEVKLLEPLKKDIEYDIQENILMVSAQPCLTDSNRAVLYSKSNKRFLAPDYANPLRAVYLIDLRRDIPDSVVVCGKSIVTDLKAAVPPGREYNYYSDLMDIRFPDKALYDTVYLNIDHTLTVDSLEIFTIGSRTVPLDKSLQVTLRPTKRVAWKEHMAVYRISGRTSTFLGGNWENGGIHFATREFGNFTILSDTIPPMIKPVSVNTTAARFKIRDNLSGISNFEAHINGKWLLMHYDSKSATIWSEKLDKAEPLRGDFKLVVTDMAGNEATYTHKIL